MGGDHTHEKGYIVIRYASLFSGVGGLGMGFDAPDYECVLLCEKDKQARSVLQRHYPETTIIPDVKDVHIEPGTINLLIGGPPCQDYSVAGRRGGLAGDKGAMWWEFHRVASEARPNLLIVENVPGLLSSDEGRCFGTIIQSLVNLGYCVSWRICDAQYWGVAQRRRRLFIVGSLGDGRCAQILFEPDCLSGNPPPRREAGEISATLAASGAGTSRPAGQGNELDFLIPQLTGTLSPGAHPGGFNGQDAYSGMLIPIHEPNQGGNPDRPSVGENGEPMFTLNTTQVHGVAMVDWGANKQPTEKPIAGTLRAEAEHNYQFLRSGMSVRRLTPRECERLMGWSDGHTRYGHDGKEMADGPRYRMCGNGVVGHVSRWLADRVRATHARRVTKPC